MNVRDDFVNILLYERDDTKAYSYSFFCRYMLEQIDDTDDKGPQ
jgi:hypothetical protein